METITEIVQLHKVENFDRKNKLNRSTKKIDSESINTIETLGVTSELMQGLGVPIFYYKTQITLHGYFDQNIENYIGGYKNLIVNKNQSLGVKYNAVDFDKKRRIYSQLKNNFDMSISKNSQEYIAFKTKRITTIEERDAAVADFRLLLEKVPFNLLHGSGEIYLNPTIYGVAVVVSINIGAIFERDMDAFFMRTFGHNEAVGIAKIEAIETAKRLEYEAMRKKSGIEFSRQNNLCNEVETPIKLDISKTFGQYKMHDLYDGLRVLSVNSEWCYETDAPKPCVFKVDLYSKTKAQKQFRYKTIYEGYSYDDAINAVEVDKHGYKSDNDKSYSSFKLNKDEVEVVAPMAIITPLKTAGINLVDYSSTCIVVCGDTKPLKDMLKDLGGKFNFRLTCGAGWIFPNSKKVELQKLLNINQ